MRESRPWQTHPCEQELYLQAICTANGTIEVDFLAEQECLCNGAYWEVSAGCNARYFQHGWQVITPEEASSRQASLSTAECQPTPPFQPFSNLLPTINLTSISLAPSLTLGNDRFPNNTAVSNYFTPTESAIAGPIRGSATGKLTRWTTTAENRYTPTSNPPNSGISITATSSTATGSGTGASSSPSTSANVAVGKEAQAAGGLILALFGVVALLWCTVHMNISVI
jgi:cytoskeletal protein RodZ